jgi:peptidoglycan hydrolase-like protein with peptidoglycan-binding domain
MLMGLVKLIGPFDYAPSPSPTVAQAEATQAPALQPEPAPGPKPEPPAAETEPASPPAPAEPAKQDLAGRLKALDAKTAREGALGGILAAWNMAVVAGYPEDDSAATLAEFGRSNGLSCEILAPALDQLMAIGLPALARMNAGEETRWTALTRIEDGRFRISGAGTETIDVPRDEFRECYANEAIIFWRNAQPAAPVLRPKTSGADVAELKRALRALSRLHGPATAVYDEETSRAVARLQAETGLFVDGVAGKQVRMVLSSWMGADSVPSLMKREKVEPLETESVIAASQEEKPEEPVEPAAPPDTLAKEQPKPAEPELAMPRFDEPELLPGFNALPDLPMGAAPDAGSPFAGPPVPAQEKPAAVTSVPLPDVVPGAVPPMPRLPGAPAPVAVQTAPERAEAVNELHS